MAHKITSRLKTHKTSMGKITRRYVFTVEVLLWGPAQHPDEFMDWHDVTDADLVEIAHWVTDHELGHRTSHNEWKLNNNEAVTMFLLRWNE
jgi:hypothetical protein